MKRSTALGCVTSLGALVLMGAIGGGIVWALTQLPPAVSALLAGAFGFLATKFYESWKESKERLYEKKREVYARLLQPWLSVQKSVVHGKDVDVDDLVKEWGDHMIEAVFDSILYASDDVLKLYANFRDVARHSPDEIMVYYPKLLRAIRKDLGNTFTSLSELDILRLFVNFKPGEVEEYRARLLDKK